MIFQFLLYITVIYIIVFVLGFLMVTLTASRIYRGFSFLIIDRYWYEFTIFGKIIAILFCAIFILPDITFALLKEICKIIFILMKCLLFKNKSSLKSKLKYELLYFQI